MGLIILFLRNYSGVPRLRSQREESISQPSQTESAYVQTVPDGMCLCPNFRAFTGTSCVHVQTFVRSPDFCALMSRLLCVQPILVRSCPIYRALNRLSCFHVQTFVRSPDFRAFYRFSCVHVRTFVRSCPDLHAFPRFICVHQVFVRSCLDFCAFVKLGCDDPIFVLSSSNIKNLFKSNHNWPGVHRDQISKILVKLGEEKKLQFSLLSFSIFFLYLNIIKEWKVRVFMFTLCYVFFWRFHTM